MMWSNLVRKYFPNATDEECDDILWDKTFYPLADEETVEKQLQEANK